MRIFNFFQTHRLKSGGHIIITHKVRHVLYTHFPEIGDYEAAASCIRANTVTAAAVAAVQAQE